MTQMSEAERGRGLENHFETFWATDITKVLSLQENSSSWDKQSDLSGEGEKNMNRQKLKGYFGQTWSETP